MAVLVSPFYFAVRQCAENRVEHGVELLANVFGQEPQHEVAVLLQEQILAAVTAIGLRAVEMLRAVQLNGEPCLGTQQVHLHATVAVERNR